MDLNIDSSKVNLTIFLHLKKAFDTVENEVLMKKLNAYCIRGKTGNWFMSYLSSQKQFYSGHHSEPKEITCGISQRSCFGPLLFIIYLNNFEKCFQMSKTSMFADDSMYYREVF